MCIKSSVVRGNKLVGQIQPLKLHFRKYQLNLELGVDILCFPLSPFVVSCTWSQPDTQGRHPPARHGHVVTAVGPKIYIHGGMAGEKLHSNVYSGYQ